MSTSRIGERILMSSQGDRWMASIASTIPSWQRQSLEIWFGAWVGLGAMLLYGVYTYPGSERQFYLICMGFWAFFALKAWRAVRWRRSGLEVIQLSPEGLEIRLDHGKTPGRTTLLPLNVVEAATVPKPNPRSFLESMEQQFWVIGGDRIHLVAQGKTRVFGKQLELREAEQLAKVFNQRLAKLKKQREG